MKKIIVLMNFIFVIFIISSCSKSNGKNIIKYNVDDSVYSDVNMWCFNEKSGNDVDTFFICPTASSGSGNMDLTVPKNLSKFGGACKMEMNIYEECTNFIAPYYHQVLLDEYAKTSEEREEALSIAYDDIKSAFEYYLMKMNNDHRIILAGFSQGADMCLRLLKDYSKNDLFYDKFVACYAIGWIVADDYLKSSKRIKMASSATDKKCIISFNCEAVDIDESFVIPSDGYTNSINPVTWSRTCDVADKSLHKGAVFYDTYGAIVREEPNITSCYIDSKRGTLKLPDIDRNQYLSGKDFMPSGVYHLWDYQFFFNNLKENVAARIG